jgi:hypothetical protein
MKLYRIVNSFCAAPQEDPLPPHNYLGQLANTFNEYVFRKIELIRENVDRLVVEPPLVEYRNPEVKLESFESLSFQDIHDVIMQLSCAVANLIRFHHGLSNSVRLNLYPLLLKL